MEVAIIAVFVLGYLAIALEHNININKAASALVTGVLCWTIYIINTHNNDAVTGSLLHHLGDIAQILFFLLGAMTIVELIDAHDGFEIITSRITTQSKRKLMWIICFISFFLSAVLDNLTTAIVMVSLIRKLINDKEDRLYFVGMIVIASNAGGAWSPIGDVTTTMLWIGGQITATNIIKEIFLPSLVCLLVPLSVLHFKMKGLVQAPMDESMSDKHVMAGPWHRNVVLFSGIGVLVSVPVFKTVTHLPPFMGIMLGLGVLWIITEMIHSEKDEEDRSAFSVVSALRKVDAPSILFFLGILLAVAALESTHVLTSFAGWLNTNIGNVDLIVIAIGLLSAIVDNVPLVAAAMGMYSLEQYPTDHHFWEFLAYCTGTGGSALIIGSAAGVAAMGIEKVEFFWYLKKISWLALIGFFAGAIVFLLEKGLL